MPRSRSRVWRRAKRRRYRPVRPGRTTSRISCPGIRVSISAEGFATTVAKVTLAAGTRQTMNLALFAASGNAPSLGDLGFPTDQTQGSAADKARLVSVRTQLPE